MPHFLTVLLASFALISAASSQDSPAVDTNPEESRKREFIQIDPQEDKPSVRAISPIDDSHVIFLNKRGQIGVAKFSPGLSLIGWEYYSEVFLDALPGLATGPDFSALFVSPNELTQAFDTDQDVELDFFQALVREWPGRDEGVVITAGPVADSSGRVLFALSHHSPEEGAPAHARIVAWHPNAESLVTLTESVLPITSMTLSSKGLLATRLHMPDYKDGFYISLNELPPFDPENPDAAPQSIPMTNPSLLIPSELTRGAEPVQIEFFRDGDEEKLLAVCPDSGGIVEIVPEFADDGWQGSILLRDLRSEPIHCLVEMGPDLLLGGGDSGFEPIGKGEKSYRISSLSTLRNGLVVGFTHPVDRFSAVKPENYTVTEVSLQGGISTLAVTPVIESDGTTVILQLERTTPGTVLRVVCQNVPSEDGEQLLSPEAFYKVHKPQAE